jgi:hypothetical protein
MSLGVGQQLGPYEIVSPLADGGMGELYRALDSRLGRMVAVKVLPPSLAKDPDRLRRFEQEARATGALDHPNVLVVHDFGTHAGAPYLVTELLEGETLRERMARGPVPPRKAAEIAARVAQGLAAAHGKHIVHRDLKPDNVFLTRDGRVKILDFGLAKVKGPLGVDTEGDTLAQRPDEATSPGLLLGTAAYMAPEQVRGEEADGRSDVFALGAILHEMLTQKRAFARGSMAETLAAILREDPPDLARLSGAVPVALQSVLRRCLEKDPADRFQSARDLGFALDALAQGADSDARRAASADLTGVFRGVSARLGLGRLGWRGAAVLLVLGAVVGAVVADLARSSPRPRVVGFRALLSGDSVPARIATDGERLYYTALTDGQHALWQVSLAGGQPERIAVPFQHAMVFDVSHRRGALLVAGWDGPLTGADSADQPVWIVPVGGGSARNTGLRAYGAAWSPDAEHVAFSGGSGDYSKGPPSSLFVAGADGSGLRKIHDAGVPIPWIRWSPDGTRVRFAAFDRKTAEFWWMEVPARGGAARRIVQGEEGDWSPDGRYFVFGRWGRGPMGTAPWEGPRFSLFARREPGRLALPGLGAGRAEDQLTFGPMDYTSPVFTPDGRRLVAAGSLRRMDVLRLEPGPPARFGRVPGVPGGFVAYSRGGEWVAWVDAAHLTLWRSRRDGSGQLQLTVPPMAAALPHWSPDGRRLVFVADPTGGRQPRAVYVVSRDGGEVESFADPENSLVWDPCWLDDHRVIWGNLYDRGSVNLLDLRSRAVSTLPGSEGMMGPKCSPDGAVLAAKEWSQGYFLFRPEAGRWESLGVPSGLWYPTFTRDGKAVLGLSLDQHAIFRFTLAARRLEKVADLGGVEPTAPWMAAWMGLDPDDRPLVLRNTGVSDIYILDWDES